MKRTARALRDFDVCVLQELYLRLIGLCYDHKVYGASPGVEFRAGDEVYFEYRKILAENEPQKHRHSMLSVKHVELDYKGELRHRTAIYDRAHLLMLKVVRTHHRFHSVFSAMPLRSDLPFIHSNRITLILKELHQDNKELELHWLDEPDLPEMYISKLGDDQTLQARWRLVNAKPLSLSNCPSPDNAQLMEYTMVLVHGGFEPCHQQSQAFEVL